MTRRITQRELRNESGKIMRALGLSAVPAGSSTRTTLCLWTPTSRSRTDGRMRPAPRGTKVRGGRTFDLLIAATAIAAGLPLYTRNADDLAGLGGLLKVVPIKPTTSAGEDASEDGKGG